MIASLTGTLKESAFTEALVDVGGVGYQVYIPLSTFDKLPRAGENVSLLIHTHVREDDIQLFGFATPDEKRLFKLLISISGVGPKIALSVLSTMSAAAFCSAISSGDIKLLSRVNGIGKKTAERMLVELKGKISKFAAASPSAEKIPDAASKASEEAVMALVQLGFKYDSAAKAVYEAAKGADAKECTSENLIRLALRSLNG